MPKPAARPLQFEFVAGEQLLQGPAAAIADVLALLNHLAAMRGARAPVLGWQAVGIDGRARRGARGPGTRRTLPDVLVVPGWQARNGAHLDQLVRRDHALLPRLQAVHRAGGQVLALYTGVALLGAAGLLAGRHAVVPWPFIPAVLRHAPGVQLAAGEAWVEDGRLWTADAPALATAVALALLQRTGLADLAEAGRHVLLHTPERQRLVEAVAQEAATRIGPGTLERACRWLETHLREPYSLAATAAAAGTSTRSLLRHFRHAHGQTPLQRLHELRITHARMLLETTYLPIETIAERCGWHDPAMLRRIFERHTGQTPAAYRQRHRLRDARRAWGRDLRR